MLSAVKRSTGEKVLADKAAKGSDIFYCPACGQDLLLRKGKIKVHHFAHQPVNKTCVYRGESQTHLKIKKAIYDYFQDHFGHKVKKIELEYYLDIVRPDIYLEGKKKKIAIEIQVSSLSPEEVIRRTALYYKLGVYVLWVLPFDAERFIQPLPKSEFISKEFRLKAYESVISYLYFKKLVFWDLSTTFSRQFIWMDLGDVKTEGGSYYSIDFSSIVDFNPKKLKTTKRAEEMYFNIGLEEMRPTLARKFKLPKSKLIIPDRYILSFNGKQKNATN